MSPKEEHLVEKIQFLKTLSLFDESKHLADREHQYVNTKMMIPGGVLIIRETEEGWWRESYNYKDEIQLEKLINDPQVAAGWISSHRFNQNGGWYEL